MFSLKNPSVLVVLLGHMVACSGSSSNPEGTGGMAGNASGGEAGQGTSTPVPDLPILETKAPSCAPAAAGLQRLSTEQYRNTVRELSKRLKIDAQFSGLEALLLAVPEDNVKGAFRGMDRRLSLNHVSAYHSVAIAFADRLVSDPTALGQLAPSCKADDISSCAKDAAKNFGRLAFRRPLLDEEVTRFSSVAAGATKSDAIRGLVVRMLTTPDFLYHLELQGSTYADDKQLVALDGHHIAARLSYLLWQNMPDSLLMQAADDGKLTTQAGLQAQVSRMLATPAVKNTVWDFFEQWWRLRDFLGFATYDAYLKSFAAGLGLENQDGDHRQQSVDEIRALTEHFTWDTKGNMRDLLLTRLSWAKWPFLNSLYGTAGARSDAEIMLKDEQRPGILTRAAFLISGDEHTSPIHRGGFIRRQLLCGEIPTPDPASLPAGSLEPPPASTSLSTRQRFEQKTAAAQCQVCHTQLNGIGFALENYDGLSRFRTTESVGGKALPINTNVVPQIVDGDTKSQTSTPLQLVTAIADSGQAEACMATQLFRFAYRRLDVPEDDCVVQSIAAELKGKNASGLAGAISKVMLHESFLVRRVSP
jgi:hypothetical protein